MKDRGKLVIGLLGAATVALAGAAAALVEPSSGMTFGAALEQLKAGARVAREGWNGRGMWLELVNGPEMEDRMQRPFIEMKDAQGYYVPWLASQTDMLADDWHVIDDDPPPLDPAAELCGTVIPLFANYGRGYDGPPPGTTAIVRAA